MITKKKNYNDNSTLQRLNSIRPSCFKSLQTVTRNNLSGREEVYVTSTWAEIRLLYQIDL